MCGKLAVLRVQVRVTQAVKAALSLPQDAVRKQDHICCRVALPPIFEGHLIKLLCHVDSVMFSPRGNPSTGAAENALTPFGPSSQGATTAITAGGALESGGGSLREPGHARSAGVGAGGSCGVATEAAGKVPQGGTLREHELLGQASKVFVFLDKALESAARLRLQEGARMLLLQPWEVVLTPKSQYAIVLAYVAVPIEDDVLL
jgi:hypothetical protein